MTEPQESPKALGTTAAARLLEKELGIKCSAASLHWHLKRGRLRDAVVCDKPFQLHPERIVAAYSAEVHNRQMGRKKHPPRPDKRRKKPDQEADHRGSPEPPVEPWRQRSRDAVAAQTAAVTRRGSRPPANPHEAINLARTWAELEKARKLQIERLASEGVYLHRSEVQPAWEAAFMAVNKSVMGVASKVKAENPALEFGVIDLIRRECRDALQKAFHDVCEIEAPAPELTEEEMTFDLPEEGQDMEVPEY